LGGSILSAETLETFGQQILQAGSDLSSRVSEDIVGADFKLYEAGGMKFGVSQVEITNFAQLAERLGEISEALTRLKDTKGLDFAMLMVTNVVEASSRLILTDNIPMLDVLPYPKQEDGTRLASGVVSRKKQLLPLILGSLEG
jgi:manganese-dependent inorganic pyrophosphatase